MVNNWTEDTIDNLKASSKNAIAMGPFGSRIKAENFVKSGIPVIKGGNLTQGFLYEENYDFLTEEKANELKTSNAFRRDIVITHRGTIGQVGIIPDTSKFDRYIVSQSQLKITLDEEKINPYFVYYFFQSPLGQHRLLLNASQVGVPAIASASTSIKQISIPHPKSRNEQDKIVEILNILNEKIALNTAMNQTLEVMAQTIFKSWFVDFEPFKEGKFIESELGMIPEGWEVKKLKELTDTITKGTTPTTMRAKFATQGINFVKAESITNTHTFETSKFMYIDNETHEKLKRSQLQNKDLLYTIAGTIGRYALVDNSILPANTNQAIAIIRPKQDMLHSEYLLCYFESIFYKTYLQSRVVQAVQANLSLGEISNSPILFPKKKVLELFHSKVEPLFRQIQQNQQQIQTLTSLRDTLLPKLMSGKVRV